jgi:hypothetical protein
MLELGFEYHSVGRRPVGVKSRAVRV